MKRHLRKALSETPVAEPRVAVEKKDGVAAQRRSPPVPRRETSPTGKTPVSM
jgi:hypothetical protein